MQYTDSQDHSGQAPSASAIAKPAACKKGLSTLFGRKGVALTAAAALLTPGLAQAQGMSIDAPIPAPAIDTQNGGLARVNSLHSSDAPLAIDIRRTVDFTTSTGNPFSLRNYLGDAFGLSAPRGPVYAAMQLRIDAPAWENDSRFAELVLDANTGEIVYERNGLDARHLASMNKVMTAYLVFEALADGTLTPDTMLTASSYAASQGGMSMNLRRGQQVSVRDALNALITVSANDAAVLLAEGVAGTEAAFAERMNAAAQRIGAVRTTFASASGRFGDDSTAYDMTLIFRQVGEDYPQYYAEYFTDNCTWCETTDIHATGRKTGTRSVAGYNVVVRIEHEGQDYIVVTMGARNNPGRFGRAIELAQAVWDSAPPTLFGNTVMASAASDAATGGPQSYAASASSQQTLYR